MRFPYPKPGIVKDCLASLTFFAAIVLVVAMGTHPKPVTVSVNDAVTHCEWHRLTVTAVKVET